MFATESIVYGAHRMMRWYTNNVYVDKDSKGNISYEKLNLIYVKRMGLWR